MKKGQFLFRRGIGIDKIVGGVGRWTVNCWVSMTDKEAFKQFERNVTYPPDYTKFKQKLSLT